MHNVLEAACFWVGNNISKVIKITPPPFYLFFISSFGNLKLNEDVYMHPTLWSNSLEQHKKSKISLWMVFLIIVMYTQCI